MLTPTMYESPMVSTCQISGIIMMTVKVVLLVGGWSLEVQGKEGRSQSCSQCGSSSKDLEREL